jgi:multiple antibiotic resistance protein
MAQATASRLYTPAPNQYRCTMDSAFLITAFATLFVVIDPVGLTPIFIALTTGSGPAHRRAIALRACGIAFAILTLFAFFGEAVLGFIGIGMPAFRIAGGILLFLTALDMLFERRSKRRKGAADEEDHPDPSVFPMAIPLIAGPGAIASIILLTGQTPDWISFFGVLGVMATVMLLVLGFFLSAGPIERALGRTGITVVTRLLGMLLAALSVQFVLDGLRAFGLGGL